jgi:hypothetical protein
MDLPSLTDLKSEVAHTNLIVNINKHMDFDLFVSAASTRQTSSAKKSSMCLEIFPCNSEHNTVLVNLGSLEIMLF